MQNSVESSMQSLLDARKENKSLRTLTINDGLIDFCSNNYLGLANHGAYDLPSEIYGATGSRLITGNSLEAETAEKKIAAIHKVEAALIYNTGYMANLGLCSAIGDRSTVFFCDEFIHASTIDGVRLSKSSKVKFAHNDAKDLEKKLVASTAAKKIVLIESVYSMNGNVAALEEIVEVVEANNALLIVDEAHATGIFGYTGAGLAQALGLEKRIWCSVHTFSKAMGLQGAAVVGSQLLIDYLINFSRSFIYATAMPPVSYSQILVGYDLLERKINRSALQKNIELFCDLFKSSPYIHLKSTPIQNIIIAGNENAMAASSFLRTQGIYAKAILSPTVPEGKECIRICLHSFNTIQELKLLHHSLQTFLK